MLLLRIIRRQKAQGSLFVISQQCIGARTLEKCISAAQREIAIAVFKILHPQAQVGEMFKHLIRVLGPLGAFGGGENAAVSDDTDDEEYSHDRAERELHF